MPECAFAELDRVVRKCLLSSFSFAPDVVVVVAVVVTREREVLPGMMKLTLWPRCRARSSVTRNENRRRSAHEVREREREREKDRETKRQLKEIKRARALSLLLVRRFVLLYLRPRAG